MDTKFVHQDHEKKIYDFWESNGHFSAKINDKNKPFSILLPPPNANADLHLGHSMYVYEDVMIRFHKLLGKETLWLPGADHAGFETQFVFEKQLKKEGKSRFDYDREILYQMIWDFVEKNKVNMENQLRAHGFALDWENKKFTLDLDIVNIVYETFKKMHDDGLIYRDTKLVNYCWVDGTSFSDLEVVDVDTEAERGLYFIKYQLLDGNYIEVATTRPETMFGDMAIMVNPEDERYTKYIGKIAKIPITAREIPIIADEHVDMKFGTGAVKVTPSHDFNDFEIGKKHNLSTLQIIGFDGKIFGTGTKYDGMRVINARAELEKDLHLTPKKHNLVLKTCYRCGKALEPLPLEQWFIKVSPLTKAALDVVKKGEIDIQPVKFKKRLLNWLDSFHDWNISRQIVWGIRIPAFYNKKENKWIVEIDLKKQKELLNDPNISQDVDTFDTWFSSAQWPFATLKSVANSNVKSKNLKLDFYDYFYPTSVMETGYDILPWWVARMIMVSLYATKQVPFKTVYLHGMVRDRTGKKMSKSVGNVINPISMIEKYGADALRAALIFGSGNGADVSFSEDKVRAMRNFANKIWNVGRFIDISNVTRHSGKSNASETHPESNRKDSGQAHLADAPAKRARMTIKELQEEFTEIKKQTIEDMEAHQFSRSFDRLYEFTWHRLADYYIEQLKDSVLSGNITSYQTLKEIYIQILILLHPFMPFVTEAVYKQFKGEEKSILKERIINA